MLPNCSLSSCQWRSSPLQHYAHRSRRLCFGASFRPEVKKAFAELVAQGLTDEPTLIAEIEFRGWSNDGKLRYASYKG